MPDAREEVDPDTSRATPSGHPVHRMNCQRVSPHGSVVPTSVVYVAGPLGVAPEHKAATA